MARFISSSKKNPCKICGRTHDGDCRETPEGIIYCHTELNGVKPGNPHPEHEYVYCDCTKRGHECGIWKPLSLCTVPTKKRAPAPTDYYDYFFWDQSPTPVQRYRKQTATGKEIKWCSGGLNGRLQIDVAPFCWHKVTDQLSAGDPLFVLKGELKTQQFAAKGLHAISILEVSERLISELRSLAADGIAIILCPDNDLPDLGGWYAELIAALPSASTLIPPMQGMDWRYPPHKGGLAVEDWIKAGSPSQEEILRAISTDPWQPGEDLGPVQADDEFPSDQQPADLDLLTYSELLDAAISSIKHRNQDLEMLVRSELKMRYRVSDDRINTDLFKRLGESKVAKVKPSHGSIVMSRVEALRYRMDGWIQRGDIGLLYGPYGSGKTTVGLWKAYNAAQGINILDRSQSFDPIKTLIIATDSGLGPLYKSFDDLGIDPETDPLLIAGHPDQMIHVWGYDQKQGHNAWICDIHGVIRLEQYIEKHGIEYVLIDSAKSVSSAAGWSYTSNEAVKALLKYLREAITRPLGCFVEFISHDGTLKGAHSGAKAWAEDPSMVCSLDVKKDEETGLKSVQCTFKKDRAAPSGQGLRQPTYYIEDNELKLAEEVEVIGNCGDAICNVLWEAYERGVDSIRTGELIDEVWTRYRKTRKTAENSFPSLMVKGSARMIRPRRGRYGLSPAEIQKRSSPPNRDPYVMGGVK